MNSNDAPDVDPHPSELGENESLLVPRTSRRRKGKRNSRGTREVILKAAREIFAQGGKGGLSVTQVAHRASIDRSTAYQHFRTREQLIEATAACTSAKLYRGIFGDPQVAKDQPAESISIESVIAQLAEFAMENPTLGRIWLFRVLSSRDPATDPFWREFLSKFEQFAKTSFAQPGIDVEVSAVLILAGAFMWPVWAHASVRDATSRSKMADRFQRELLRLCLHGTMKPEKFGELTGEGA